MRPTARQRGYDSKWDRARRAFLAAHPFCAACERRGKLIPATVVDHIEPHRGDYKLFWRRSNWQALCKPCHDRDKQQVETRGYATRVEGNGLPSDPNHPFNRPDAILQQKAPGGSKVKEIKGFGPAGSNRAELVASRGLCGRAR